MAECIIARGGSYRSGEANIPITSDRCSVLVTIKDSTGNVITDSSVHCNDGGTWYNYHTNNRGQVLFMTNSGQVDISAWNFSLNQNCRYFDQNARFSNNIDTPVGTVKNINLALTKGPSAFNKAGIVTGDSNLSSMTSNIYDFSNIWMNNYKFFVYNYANIKLVGGGGGGTYGHSGIGGGGGGGGGAAYINDISINHNRMYKFSLGDGGKAGWYQDSSYAQASSGGTTSAFGYVANGGGGGYGNNGGREGRGTTYNGGNGGNINSHGYDGEDPNSGGGGGGGAPNQGYQATNGGNPCGGDGGYNRYGGDQGGFPGGGGGGSGLRGGSIAGYNTIGGYGGAGWINLVFR